MPDTTLARSLKGGIQRAVMGAQIKTIEMAMGVNQHTKNYLFINSVRSALAGQACPLHQ